MTHKYEQRLDVAERPHVTTENDCKSRHRRVLLAALALTIGVLTAFGLVAVNMASASAAASQAAAKDLRESTERVAKELRDRQQKLEVDAMKTATWQEAMMETMKEIRQLIRDDRRSDATPTTKDKTP